ncbi:MAG: NADH-quinone oxidoreductase subunit L [Candidatus Omnitrophica bacterium CG11_big_fil_rev_8_21_14_0_20_64_10]|nr:MAG: NADH-quinone oxidoreductase subunit L [Candidatus Omnitrophica bacterium CG11_big_fil_rev_8_21_14_0_20_64_10]
MLLSLIPLLPLAAFVILIFFGRRLGKFSPLVSLTALMGSVLLSFSMLGLLQDARFAHTPPTVAWNWILFGGRRLTFALLADPLAVTMCLVVTVIGWGIMLYSVGYMKGDPRYSRFFAYLSLFFASMLTLVLADHLVLLYIAWEGVGLCSYLLISFWFEKPAAAAAGKKAFLTTRVGDLGLLLGILLLALKGGELSFRGLAAHPEAVGPWAALAAVLLFWGAVGKSAQFPLHVWLPDAMEGPTAVSALIHAATMVAAGVYLTARAFPLFLAGPEALQVVGATGAVTTFFAATIACTQTDLKKILAYSTISQLGFMMLALGCGAAFAGMFHLVTHAAFKALLFLCAGSVIHAVHHQDVTRMGGLLRSMPITGATFLIAAFAMAGVPPLAGFWSKEAVLAAAAGDPLGRGWLLWTAAATAGLTAFYITRAGILIFLGSPRGNGQAHESSWTMTVPLIFLALGAVGIGWINGPWTGHAFERFLHLPVWAAAGHGAAHGTGHGAGVGHGPGLLILSLVLAGGGIGLAFLRYGLGVQLLPERLRRAGQPIYRVIANKYFIDELYEAVLIRPFLAISRALFRFDQRGVDGAVNGAGLAGLWVSRFKGWVDRRIVDGAVNGAAAVTGWLGAGVRGLQTGWVQHYLLIAVVGGMVLLLLLIRGWA